MFDDKNKYRILTYNGKRTSTPILYARISSISKCAIVSCQRQTIYASSYCYRHRLNQKISGSPFALTKDLRVISADLRGHARSALTSNPSDLMAYERACRSIKRYTHSRYKTDGGTNRKYRRHWSNAYKAPLAIWMALKKITPEELLEVSLGAALHLYMHRDDLAVTERHFTNLLAKSMASVVVPNVFSQGERTRAGRLIINILDECYSPRYWRGCLREMSIHINKTS
jgi:hypothetical protein